MEMQSKHINQTDFTLWEVEFSIVLSYDRDDFTFQEAKEDFKQKVGIEALEEEDDETMPELLLTTEIQYYACDSGHGGNIINDCLIALQEDCPGFDEIDYEYEWRRLDYEEYLNEPYISWALDISSYGDIKINDEILRGECLGLVWQNCQCENCV
jgi:hypothetical protein